MLWTRRLPYRPTEDERMSHSISHFPFRAWCVHYVKGLARDWSHRSECGPQPDIPMDARNFCFTNTESDDDVWTILAMNEKPFQFAGATVLPVKTVSKIAVATIIGYLDCWDRQEVIIKCKQQNMVRRAELLQGRRRPRGTIVECILEGRRQSNVVVENAHHHLADNTGESVDVKPLLASWLVRYCVWKLARLAIGDDGLTTFRRQCKIVQDHSDECWQINNGTQRHSVCLWKYCGAQVK